MVDGNLICAGFQAYAPRSAMLSAIRASTVYRVRLRMHAYRSAAAMRDMPDAADQDSMAVRLYAATASGSASFNALAPMLVSARRVRKPTHVFAYAKARPESANISAVMETTIPRFDTLWRCMRRFAWMPASKDPAS